MGMSNINFKAAATLLTLCCVPSLALANNGNKDDESATESSVFYSELDVSKNDVNLYSSYIFALNRDLGKDGVLFRVEGLYDHFMYSAGLDRPQTINGTEWQGAAFVGYQIVRNAITYSGYMGVDVPSVTLSPNDPTNPVRGTEVGFKVKGEMETDLEKTWYLDITADYSTAFQTYDSRIRPGWKFGSGKPEYQIVIGPEAGFLGDRTFDAQRLGAFVLVPIKVNEDITAQFIIAAGYQWVEDRGSGAQNAGDSGPSTAGEAGAYGTASFEIPF
jgi:hypothetical protein